jgi:hypothetical protein
VHGRITPAARRSFIRETPVELRRENFRRLVSVNAKTHEGLIDLIRK